MIVIVGHHRRCCLPRNRNRDFEPVLLALDVVVQRMRTPIVIVIVIAIIAIAIPIVWVLVGVGIAIDTGVKGRRRVLVILFDVRVAHGGVGGPEMGRGHVFWASFGLLLLLLLLLLGVRWIRCLLRFRRPVIIGVRNGRHGFHLGHLVEVVVDVVVVVVVVGVGVIVVVVEVVVFIVIVVIRIVLDVRRRRGGVVVVAGFQRRVALGPSVMRWSLVGRRISFCFPRGLFWMSAVVVAVVVAVARISGTVSLCSAALGTFAAGGLFLSSKETHCGSVLFCSALFCFVDWDRPRSRFLFLFFSAVSSPSLSTAVGLSICDARNQVGDRLDVFLLLVLLLL